MPLLSWRSSRRGTAGLVVVVALLLAPLIKAMLTVEVLGLQDLPYHLVVARLAATAPESLPAGVVRAQVPGISPYRAIYAVLGSMGHGREHAVARWLLVAYLLATVAAVFALTALFPSGDPWRTTACVPLAMSAFFWSGFLVYLLAIPVLLWLLWVELRRMDGDDRISLSAAVAGCFLCLYILHPLVLMLGIGVSLSALVVRRSRGYSVACWPTIVGLALGGLAVALVIEGTLSLPSRLVLGGDGLLERATLLASNTFAHLAPPRRERALLGTLAMVAGLVLGSRALHADGPRSGAAGLEASRRRVLVSAWGMCLAATLAIPFFAGGLAYAGSRFALPTLLLGTALAAGPFAAADLSQRARRWAGLLTVTGAWVLSLNTAGALASVSDEVAPLVRLGRQLSGLAAPPRVLRLTFEPRSASVPGVFCLGATAHVHALLQAGAVDAELFDNPFLPVVLVGEHPRAPDVFHPERYRRQWHGAGVTHVLLRLPGLGVARTVESRQVVARLQRDFVLEARDGPWSLWQRPRRADQR